MTGSFPGVPGERIAVVGAGIVGVRTARELLTPLADGGAAVGRVLLVGRRPDRLEQLAGSFGSSMDLLSAEQREPALDGVSTVVVARAPGEQLAVARDQVAAGRHVVTTSDDPDEVEALLALDDEARARGVSVVVGAAMSPGLSCLLARHGASLMDQVEEIHVAHQGVAGPACARSRHRALRGTALEWRDGSWVRRPGFSGRELCWFPDPVGARDCYRAELAEPLLLVDAFPEVHRVTARLAATRRDRVLTPLPAIVPPSVEGGPGGMRVELRGRRDGAVVAVVYGLLDRPGVAAASTAAVSALWVAAGRVPAGAHGLAACGPVLPLLTELARRGVRSAVFEGSGEAPVVPPTSTSV